MPLFDEGSWKASSLYQVSRIKSIDIGISDINQSRAMRIAQRRIEGFAQQFGEAHRNLARHAAFPLVLTPDLLYQIWANFVPQAPWTAVAHVLLSRLCRQVGYEMYEMDIADRNLLLRELKEEFGQERLNELGEFLLDYVAQRLTDDDADTQDLREAQEWTALAYTKPDEAARELALRLSQRVQQEDMGEVLRLASLVENLAEPLMEAGFEPLLVYGQGIKSFVRGDLVKAAKQFSYLPKTQVAGVNFNVPQIGLNQPASQDNRQKFLVVDDHKLILSGTIEVLKQQYPNAEITKAETSQEALNLFANNPCLPDLMITNLSMPETIGQTAEIDVGIQFLKTLMQQYPNLNIVVQSSYPRALVRLKILISVHEGGFTVADKGLPIQEFLTRVDWALQGLTHTKDIKDFYSGLEVKPEWFRVLTLAFEESLQDKAIAQRMNVAERTVRHYWTKIYDLLGVYPDANKNLRIQTEIRAREEGLIDGVLPAAIPATLLAAQPVAHHRLTPPSAMRQGVYGLECPRCHKVSPLENLQVGCPWCGTSLAAAASVLMIPNGGDQPQ